MQISVTPEQMQVIKMHIPCARRQSQNSLGTPHENHCQPGHTFSTASKGPTQKRGTKSYRNKTSIKLFTVGVRSVMKKASWWWRRLGTTIPTPNSRLFNTHLLRVLKLTDECSYSKNKTKGKKLHQTRSLKNAFSSSWKESPDNPCTPKCFHLNKRGQTSLKHYITHASGKVAMRRVVPRARVISPVAVIPPLFHIPSCII
jgi:hypothetical protein